MRPLWGKQLADRCQPNNKALRKALDAPDGFPASRHREYIDRVRLVHPHTVVYREARDQSTCVLYALDLSRDAAYRAIATNFAGRVFADRAFMEWWLAHGHPVELDEPTKGCMVMYFREGIWQHVGISSDYGRVLSQWGTFHVYDHGVCELPARYGDEVRYFRMPALDDLMELFLQFAKTQGISDSHSARVKAATRS